jgi:hypothetical protein
LQSLTLIGTYPTVEVQLHDLSPIAGLRNLTSLEYRDTFCLGITALTTLTALTSLSIVCNPKVGAKQQYAKPTTQAALAAALPALASLKQLSLSEVQSGPLTDALSQLTSLTQLTAHSLKGVSKETPQVLPINLNVLELPLLDVSALCGIITPHTLQHVTVKATIRTGRKVGRQGVEADLKHLAEGMLEHCADLSLTKAYGTSKEDMVALMAVLKDTWRPTSTARTIYTGHLLSRPGISDSDSLAWGLTLREVTCSPCVLQQVPTGITNLLLK